jgi:hypothetical protein
MQNADVLDDFYNVVTPTLRTYCTKSGTGGVSLPVRKESYAPSNPTVST